MTSITIPQGISHIFSYTFSGCKALKSVTIPSSVTRIDKYAFSRCDQLTDIYCKPKQIRESQSGNTGLYTHAEAFSDSYQEFITLHVSASSVEAYKEIAPWKDFKEVVALVMPIHTLTYIVDGKTYTKYQIEEESMIIPEVTPTREGYTFSGWSEIPETMPAKDVTITGSFRVNKYNLIYKVDDNDYKSYDVEYGSTITPEETPTKEGYTFSGWSEIPEIMPAKEVTITGFFSVNKHNLIYKVNDNDYKSYDVEYGSTITPEESPTKEGYAFSGWSEIPETMPNHDVEINGRFFLPGDANGDDVVNIADIVEIVNFMNNKPSENFDELAANVTVDDKINEDDIAAIIDIIMNK